MAQTPAQTQDAGLALATSRMCMSCHQVDAKRVGPSFRLVRDRFQGDPAAEAYLAQSIRDGGRGRWGAIPMPAQPQVNAADAQALARWILQLEAGKTP